MAEQKKKLKDVLQAIYNAVKALVVQPDYAQNDSTQSDYIKNRTHYVESVSTSSVWYQTNVEVGSGTSSPGAYSGTFTLTSGRSYRVVITSGGNTVTYNGIVAESYDNGMLLRKNWANITSSPSAQNDAFYILVQASSIILASVDVYGSNCIVQVSETNENVHKLDAKYLPENLAEVVASTYEGSRLAQIRFDSKGNIFMYNGSDWLQINNAQSTITAYPLSDNTSILADGDTILFIY